MTGLTISHSAEEDTLLTGTARGDGTYEAMTAVKQAVGRRRWARSLGYWIVVSSRDRQPKQWVIDYAVTKLREAAYTVEVDLDRSSRATEDAGQWATLAPATGADLGTHALATIDTTLTDLVSIRTRLATTLTSPPNLVYPGASLPDLEVLGPAHAVTRAFDRFVVPTRFISISLNQWSARTPDDYDDAARLFAGDRALGFLDTALTQLASIRDALAADLAEHRTGDPA